MYKESIAFEKFANVGFKNFFLLYTRQIEFTSCEKDENYLQNLIITKSVGDYGGDIATFEPVLGKNEKGEDNGKLEIMLFLS